MTAADKHYRELWKGFGGLYLKILGQMALGRPIGVSALLDALQITCESILRWTDITAAARLRWNGTHERTRLPSTEIADVIDANPWLQEHVKETDPLIRWRAEKVREAEDNFLIKRAIGRSLAAVPYTERFLPPVATYRLERFRRDTVGEIVNVSEQVELAVPAVGNMFPFAEFLTREDARVRPTHAAMHRFVALRSWRGWSVICPKCGWNCRCYANYRTRAQAIDRGWMTSMGQPKFEVRWPNSASESNFLQAIFPDKGWRGPKFWAFPEAAPATIQNDRAA